MGVFKIKNPETGAWEIAGMPVETVGMQMDLLWSNPNPTAEFPAQTVALDLSQYEAIRFVCAPYYDTKWAYYFDTGLYPKNQPCVISAVMASSAIMTGTPYYCMRTFTFDNNGIVFVDGMQSSGSTFVSSNGQAIIPVKIYGIRNVSSSNPVGNGTTESINHPGCFYRMVNGVQEWLNPPMELGVEYKTTERYMGKPVYYKAIDCGAGPNNTSKTVSHGISNVEYIDVPCSYMRNSSGTITGCGSADNQITQKYRCVLADGTNVVVAANDNRSEYAFSAVLRYTKTTD